MSDSLASRTLLCAASQTGQSPGGNPSRSSPQRSLGATRNLGMKRIRQRGDRFSYLIFGRVLAVRPARPWRGSDGFKKWEKRLHALRCEQVPPTNKHTSFISLPLRPPALPPSLSFRDRTQSNLCLRCTGREQTNRGLLWPLISRSYAAPVQLQRPD